MSLDDLICPICLDFPHNAVLLKCTYFEKGCRPFICDAPKTLSNCLERFKIAHGMQSPADVSEARALVSHESNQSTSAILNGQLKCPLCRGDVTECVVIEESRDYLNKKMRSCQDSTCTYSGNYVELEKHTKLFHPHAHVIVVDPIKLSEWEALQQSSDLRDVLITLYSEMSNEAMLGDYTVESGDSEAADEFIDFPGDEGQYWISGLINEVFNNLSTFRNQRNAVPEITSDYRRQNSVTYVNDRVSYANTEDDGINDLEITTPSYASGRRTSNNHRTRRRRLNP